MAKKRKTSAKPKKPVAKAGLRPKLFSRSAKFHIYLMAVVLLVFGTVFTYKSLRANSFAGPPEPANPFVYSGTLTSSSSLAIVTGAEGDDSPVPLEERGTNSPLTNAGTITATLNYSGPVDPGIIHLYVQDSNGQTVANSTSGNPIVISMPASVMWSYQVGNPGIHSIASGVVVPFTLTVTWTPSPSPSLPAPAKPAPAPVPVKDTTPPTVPAVLTAKATGATTIVLTWGASTDTESAVGGYHIYRGTSSGSMSLVTTVPGSLYVDSSVSASTTYYYYVTAFDTAGNVSDPSNTATTTTKDPPPPLPTLTVANPKDGDTVSGTVAITGTSGGGTPPVKSVQVEVDNNGFVTASGTTNWEYQLNTKLYADTAHTITIKAIDSIGTSTTTAVNLTFKNSSYSAEPPLAQGTWVSPEGMKITVNSVGKSPHTGQAWTIADAYYMVKACAVGTGDFGKIAPYYAVDLGDETNRWADDYTSLGVGTGGDGNWSNFGATSYLDGVVGPMLIEPYDVACYEYGHAWTNYYYYMVHYRTSADNLHGSGIIAPPDYLSERWVNSTGSVTLAQNNACQNSTDGWDGCMTDDRRILFGGTGTNGGSDAADRVPGEPNTGYKEPTVGYINNSIIPPGSQPGLADWYTNHWIAGQ